MKSHPLSHFLTTAHFFANLSSSPKFLVSFISDMKKNINSVLDLEHMCVNVCLENKEIVNRVFQEVGEEEFTFIRRSGFYFGFFFGCCQAGIWLFYDAYWMLPVCGFVVGWFTNYLALKVICDLKFEANFSRGFEIAWRIWIAGRGLLVKIPCVYATCTRCSPSTRPGTQSGISFRGGIPLSGFTLGAATAKEPAGLHRARYPKAKLAVSTTQ